MAKFKAVLYPQLGNKVEQTFSDSLLGVRDWAVKRLGSVTEEEAKKYRPWGGVRVRIFRVDEVLIHDMRRREK